jgi:predicted ArsR family transcriptional regulator
MDAMNTSAASGRGEDAHGLGPTRARVLGLLQDLAEPVTAVAAAQRLGLHSNPARVHLEALAEEGLVAREPERRSSPGRPRVLYVAATATPQPAHRSYRFLAQVLTDLVHGALTDPAASAVEAGAAWGRTLVAPRGAAVPDVQQTVDTLVSTLERVGFASSAVVDEKRRRLEITHCPFLEVAAERQDVVCSVHLGLLRGVADQLDAPLTAEGLDPLVAPGLCYARLAERPSSRLG